MPAKKYNKLFKKKSGARLDVGAGFNVQKGWIGLDIQKLPGVDIVHDIQKIPWPVPSNSCFQVLLSHCWEHIEPKYRFAVMDELWRIIQPDGQLLISCPYAGTYLDAAHPAHYGCPNELTFTFFDPDYAYFVHAPIGTKPWKIVRNMPNPVGCIEVILEPRKNAK